MAETRIQIAYHFKIDPAKLSPGLVRLPEQITRTISAGDELITEKVSPDCLPPQDRDALRAEIEKLTKEATRTAKPLGSSSGPAIETAAVNEEISAF